MDSADLPRLIYLVLLGTAVAGWFIAENRGNLGKTARMAVAWGLIFIGVIAAYGLWEDIRGEIMPRQSILTEDRAIEVPRAGDGHFNLVMHLNGEPIDFVVDTGATEMVLSLDDARRAGIDPDSLTFFGTASTANGEVKTAFTTIDEVAIGPVTFNRVRVAVNAGEMRGSLLGMSFLNRFDRIEIAGSRLRLEY